MHRSTLPVFLMAAISIALSAGGATAGQDDWIEVHSDHFIVVSDAGEERARRIATQLETIRVVFLQALPGVPAAGGRPLRVFAMRDRRRMQELLPQYRDVDRLRMPVGIFLRGQDENFVVLLEDADTENPYEVVFHEYFHSLAMPLIPWAPLWFHEGIAGFWENTVIQDDSVETGLPSAQYLELLENERPMPLEELLTADRTFTDSLSEHRTSVFYAQSWALMHYFMLGDRREESSGQITPYLRNLREGAPGIEAFESAFGDLDDVENRLRQYLNRFRFQALRFDKPEGIEDANHTALALGADQYHALRGSLFVHIGATAEARAEIDRAVELNPDNAVALEAQGVLLYRSGAYDEAKAIFERAASLNGTLYLPRYYLALIELPQVRDQESLLRVQRNLERAVQLNPSHAASLARLSSLYVSSGEEVELSLALARRAAGLRPEDPNAHFARALAAKANGEITEARTALELVTLLAPGFQAAHDELAEVVRIEQYPMSGAWAFNGYAVWIRIDVDNSVTRCRAAGSEFVIETGVLEDGSVTWSLEAPDGTSAEITEQISLAGGELELRSELGEFRLRRVPDLPEPCNAASAR